MENKNKILIIIISIVLVVIFFAILFFAKKDTNLENDNNEEEVENKKQEILENKDADQIKKIGEENMEKFLNKIEINDEELYTKQLAKIFTERFITYSNQNENVHIEEVKTLVTDSMYDWVKTNSLKYSEDYEGMTSQVLSSQILEFDAKNSVVLLGVKQTLQKEVDGVVETENKTKEAKVELIKIGDDWLVDGFFWEE